MLDPDIEQMKIMYGKVDTLYFDMKFGDIDAYILELISSNMDFMMSGALLMITNKMKDYLHNRHLLVSYAIDRAALENIPDDVRNFSLQFII